LKEASIKYFHGFPPDLHYANDVRFNFMMLSVNAIRCNAIFIFTGRMTTPEELSDANLVESVREHARWQEPCDWIEAEGVILVAGATDFPGAYWNGATRVDRAVEPVAVLNSAQRFFAPRRRGYSVFVRESRDQDLEAALKAEGRESRFDFPCMLVERPLSEHALPPGIRVERFANRKHVDDFVRISAAAYATLGLAAVHTVAMFGRREVLLGDHIAGFVAYRGETPLATAFALMSGEGAGLYWVGTMPDAQRAGLATICTALATNAAFECGAAVVTLQASHFGEPVYERLGYKTYDRLRRYSIAAPK
jgi:ribosomal protein S18 acetylase RimI-like enzyme